jgi:hypothetical protein
MNPFNVGVVGIGDISDVYINNLKTYDIVNVLACAGRDLEKARRKAEAHGLARAYATAQELVADPDVDIVHRPFPMLGIALAVMIALLPALSLVMEAKRESTATRPLTGHSILAIHD